MEASFYIDFSQPINIVSRGIVECRIKDISGDTIYYSVTAKFEIDNDVRPYYDFSLALLGIIFMQDDRVGQVLDMIDVNRNFNGYIDSFHYVDIVGMSLNEVMK